MNEDLTITTNIVQLNGIIKDYFLVKPAEDFDIDTMDLVMHIYASAKLLGLINNRTG